MPQKQKQKSVGKRKASQLEKQKENAEWWMCSEKVGEGIDDVDENKRTKKKWRMVKRKVDSVSDLRIPKRY